MGILIVNSGRNRPSGFKILAAVALPAIAAVALGGCSTTDTEYAGPVRPASETAIVEVGKTALFDGTQALAVLRIDGNATSSLALDQLVPFSVQDFTVLPGEHDFLLGAMPGKSLLSGYTNQSQYLVHANLQPGKRYKFVGNQDYSVGSMTLAVLSGASRVDIDLVNETDGTTASCKGSPAYCGSLAPDTSEQAVAQGGSGTSVSRQSHKASSRRRRARRQQ
jgi:hypothetical protein